MNKLNENCVYSLEDLTSEEINILSKHLTKEHGWNNQIPHNNLFYNLEDGWMYNSTNKTPTHNAKELFYTLDNVQVDCSELTKEQIEEMCKVYESRGFKKWKDPDAFKIEGSFTYLKIDWENEFYITGGNDNLTTITYEKFMELFGPQYEVKYIAEEAKAYKETSNKLNYELDFNFITQLAERMDANKGKYEPYNWQKMDNVEDLKQALLRHVLEVMKGDYEDDNRLFGHLEAIALNSMFINYQLNKK